MPGWRASRGPRITLTPALTRTRTQVGELLSLAGTSYETVKATGCTLSVTFIWSCFTDNAAACVPQIQVRAAVQTEREGGGGFGRG